MAHFVLQGQMSLRQCGISYRLLKNVPGSFIGLLMLISRRLASPRYGSTHGWALSTLDRR
ncbi:hypothetical protein RSAG8_09638, partial [Rhizoctonia solani AG-8 WAC10335]